MKQFITKQLRTETGHRLSMYDGRCSHIHGHSYLWEVTVTTSKLTDNGMVADFKDVKEAMTTVLDPLDHALVLWREDPMVQKFGVKHLDEMLRATNGQDPRLFLMPWNPTAENFAAWAAQQIDLILPPDLKVARVKVWETATSFAEYVTEA